jgi:predicted secreted protein
MNHLEATCQDKAKQIWRVKLTESETAKLPKRSATVVCYNYTSKYFEITLEASDIILLMFSNNFRSASWF